MYSFILKADFSQQEASSSGMPPWEDDGISQLRVAMKTRGSESPDQSHEKPTLFTEPVSLAYHHREPVVPAYLWIDSQYFLHTTTELAVPGNPWMRVIYSIQP
jgi:hypothetical protein